MALIRLLLAALLPLLAGRAAAAATDRLPCYDATTCQARDSTGSFGLVPSRRYQIAMSQNTDLCSAIVGALERATRMPRQEALDRVAKTPAGAPVNNPLFGSPLFLPWHIGTGAAHHTIRWLVAPVLNDGKPVLVIRTQDAAGETGPAPQQVSLWRIPPGEAGKDWSDPATRAALTPLSQTLRPAETTGTSPLAVQDGDDPLFRTLRLYGWPDPATAPAPLNMLPALPPQRQIGFWQRSGHRAAGAAINFARYGNDIYTIATGAAFDVFLVFKLHPDSLGEDVCYLNSDISQRLWRAYVLAR